MEKTQDLLNIDIERTYEILAHEKVTEIRLIDPHKQSPPKSIFVEKKSDFVSTCKQCNGQWNIYVGINERKDEGKEKKDVLSVKTVVIDIDPIRETNTAATNEELEKAKLVAFEIEQSFVDLGFVRPVKAMSGNGVQLWFAFPKIEITESNRDEIEGKVKAFIFNVQKKFNSKDVKIDQIGDLPRIIKVMGTTSIKGIATTERPHRIAEWLYYPGRIEDSKFREELLKLEPIKQVGTNWENEYADKKESRSEIEFGAVCNYIKQGFSKEDIFRKMMAFDKWAHAHHPNYREYTYRNALEATKDDLKENRIVEQKDVPTLELINFDEYKKLFENTHSHLISFNLVKEELALIGEDYYAPTKALAYMIESLRQPTIQFWVGTEPFDNRMHLLFIGGAGTGKGMAKKVIRNCNNSVECAGARTNLEQLIGKKIKTRSGEEELKGYFGYKALIIDESQKLIQEVDDQQGAIMREIRLAMDIYGYNKSEKKLVDTHLLSYCPETRFTLMVHDIVFPPLFFDTGTFRRMFAFELRPQKVKANDLIANLTRVRVEKEITEYLNQKDVFCPNTIHFSEEAIHEIVEDYIEFIRFLCCNPNQRVRAFGKNLAFAGKVYFFRLAAILGLSKNEVSITRETARQASLDAIHFLLNTIQVYGNKSNPTLSRDSWKTDSFEEAMLFEWIHYNKALSEVTTCLSIHDVQEKIGEYFGVMDRQAIKVYSAMKKKGLVLDYKGQHDSKCWLGFNPKLDDFVDFSGSECSCINFLEWLRKKLESC